MQSVPTIKRCHLNDSPMTPLTSRSDVQALLTQFIKGHDVKVPLATGVCLYLKNAVPRLGLTLSVKKSALQPDQVQQVLSRRFEQTLIFDRYFVFLDPADSSLVIWNDLNTCEFTLEHLNTAVSRALSLVKLGSLDRYLTLY